MAVLKTQEMAGLDLIRDGERVRFDPTHPETNGMVDYFRSRMDGSRKHFSLSDFDRFRSDRASGYRRLTAGMGRRENSGRHSQFALRLRVREPAHQGSSELHLYRPAYVGARAEHERQSNRGYLVLFLSASLWFLRRIT